MAQEGAGGLSGAAKWDYTGRVLSDVQTSPAMGDTQVRAGAAENWHAHYSQVLADAQAIVLNRDGKGRNKFCDLYATRAHGAKDVSGECYQRITRILGAELAEMEDGVDLTQVLLEDSADLINEAIFLHMFLKRERCK